MASVVHQSPTTDCQQFRHGYLGSRISCRRLHLLPQHGNLVGLHVAEYYEPAEEVGGDYLDVIPLDDEMTLLCLADVAGHGVPAALAATSQDSVDQVVSMFNDAFHEFRKDRKPYDDTTMLIAEFVAS